MVLGALLSGPGTAGPALAGTAPDPARQQHLSYQARFLGLPVGDVAVRLTDPAPGAGGPYAIDISARATGLFWALKGLRAHRQATGHLTAAGELAPRAYRRAYQEWEKSGDVRVAFDRPDGIPLGFRNGRPDTRIPAERRVGTLDPLSALMAMRRAVMEEAARRSATGAMPGVTAGREPAAHRPTRLTLPIYDGKLRYQSDVTLGPPEPVDVAGQPWRARVATIRFDPVDGFSDRHGAQWRAGGMRVVITDHIKAIPLRIELDQGWGRFELVYRGRCTGGAAPSCPEETVPAPVGDAGAEAPAHPHAHPGTVSGADPPQP